MGDEDEARIPIKVPLARVDLLEYLTVFERAGFTFLTCYKHYTDAEVEEILEYVERRCGAAFPAADRIQLWRALRHVWFRGPGHDCPRIEKHQVPKIAFLPKREYRQIDSTVKHRELESDRQRQVIRKTSRTEAIDTKPAAVQTIQFEVYTRQPDLWYEFKDTQQSIREWACKNPREMLRDDPREECLKMQVRKIMDQGRAQLMGRQKDQSYKQITYYVLVVMQVCLGMMAALMFWTAYYRYRNTPMQLMLGFIGGSKQTISGAAYLCAFWFAYAITMRHHSSFKIKQLTRIVFGCERLIQELSDFKFESENKRMDQPAPFQETKPKDIKDIGTRHRSLTKKKSKDPGVMALQPDPSRRSTKASVKSVQQYALPAVDLDQLSVDQIPESLQQRRDRMGNKFAHFGGASAVSHRAPRFAVLTPLAESHAEGISDVEKANAEAMITTAEESALPGTVANS